MEESTISDFIEHTSNQLAHLNEKIKQFERLNGQVEAVLSVFELMYSEDDGENLLDIPPEIATRFESVANNVSAKLDGWVEMNIGLRDSLQSMQTKVIDISKSIAQLSLSQDVTEALDEESQEILSKLNSKFEELQSAGDGIISLMQAKSEMLQLVVAGFVEGKDINKFDELLSSIEDSQDERP